MGEESRRILLHRVLTIIMMTMLMMTMIMMTLVTLPTPFHRLFSQPERQSEPKEWSVKGLWRADGSNRQNFEQNWCKKRRGLKNLNKTDTKNWEKRQTFEKRGSEGGLSHQFWLLFRKKGNNTKRDVCLKSCLVERLWESLKSISNAISYVRLEPREKENDSEELML